MIIGIITYSKSRCQRNRGFFSKEKRGFLICTPKVRQTFGGAYFYEKKEGMEHKILARIQNICYNGYAREPFRIS